MKVLADKKQIILLLVMTLAALFIFINLGRPDVIHDETIISFRALGYIDFFAESGQTTTLDWYQRPPWWTKLSFHDHQPFGYILNYIFLNLFGTSAFVVRLVSALAGLSSVFLVYLIGRRLFGENAGLLAGFIFAINNFSLWIARIAFQESLVIALALSSLYFFLLALERKYCLILSALLLGLAFITKYTAIFILPVYLVILLINKRSWFKTKEFYLSLIVFLIIISPVVLYNVFLFADRGHFDLQLPYLFGLTGKVAGWDNLVGKSDLSFWQRYASLPFELTKYLSPLFLVTSLVALAYLFWLYKRDKFNILMLVLSLVSVLLLIGLVGPQERFLTMFMPFLALAISLFFITLFTRPKALRFTLGFLIIFASYEIFYSINSLHFINSIGRPPYAYSDFVKRIRGDWGFNNLDKYLSRELAGKVPERRFALSHPYLEEKFFKKYEKATGESASIVLVYDFNIKDGPDIWYLKRRWLYDGWPLVTADTFLENIRESGPNYYIDQGFTAFYFIQATNNTLLRDVEVRTDAGKQLGDSLLLSQVQPVEIKNFAGELSLLVYKF